MKKLIINTNNYLKKACYNEKRSEYRWKNAKRRKQFWGTAKSLEDCHADGDDGEYRETTRDSDNGEYAERLFSEVEKEVSKKLFEKIINDINEIIKSLNATDQKIAEALKEDFRTAVAARITNSNRPHVDRVKKLLRVKLAPVYAEWNTLLV